MTIKEIIKKEIEKEAFRIQYDLDEPKSSEDDAYDRAKEYVYGEYFAELVREEILTDKEALEELRGLVK